MDGPATRSAVLGQLGMVAGDDDDGIDLVCAAVNATLARLPIVKAVPADAPAWPADVLQGATMLAARVYRRRASPGGVETLGDLGPVYVRRNDPDVAMLLQLGDYTVPAVG